MSLNDTLRFIFLLTIRTYAMVRMIAGVMFDGNDFLHECDEWFDEECQNQNLQMMINDLYN